MKIVLTTISRQIYWIAALFAIFFTFSGVVQYFYVKGQINKVVLAELDRLTNQINKEMGYENKINFEQINKAPVDAKQYFVFNKDGLLIDALGDKVPKLITNIELFDKSESVFVKPITIITKYGETWRMYGRHLKGGTLILGISNFSNAKSLDKRLVTNAGYFGMTLESAAKVNMSLIDNEVDHALIDDAGTLISVAGRIPIRSNDNNLLNAGNVNYQRTIDGKTYLIMVKPFLDKSQRPNGTIIIPQDISLEQHALAKQITFNIFMALLSFVILFSFGLFYSSKKEAEKRMIREAFQNYFSPQIMEAILKDPSSLKLGGQKREVTILFSDIRSFTSLSERLSAEQLTHLLQEYFTEMTDEVIATDGIVDKYIGDAIMAFWGAPIDQPDQADRAVLTAINMIKRLKILQAKWLQEGYPLVDVGIGINAGIATIGNMGSKKRFDYTLIGDAVNAASRIEDLNKKYQSNIIISQSTKDKLTIPLDLTDLGDVTVQGKTIPIKIFKVEV